MRLIHCADWHLESSLRANLDAGKAKLRREELLSSFLRMVSYGEQNGVQGILIAGDLFDTGRIFAAAKNKVLSVIRDHEEINFFYLRGNHDSSDLLEGISECPDNLFLFEDKWVHYDLGGVLISGIEIAGGEGPAACRKLRPVPDCFRIVMMHGQESASAGTDRGEIIPLKELQGKGIDYLALGHVHSYRTGRLDERGIWCYPGCPEGRGFDECGTCGFVLLDIDPEKRTFTHTFIPFARRTVHEIPVDVTGCSSDAERAAAADRILEELQIPAKDLVKLVLTGEIDGNDSLEKTYLEIHLQDRFFALKVEDRTSVRMDGEDYRLDRSLKGEFVRTVMADDSLTEEEKKTVIRIGLRAIAGEEVAE